MGLLVVDLDSGTRKCVKCQGLFCINCKVPWHKDMTCYEYKRLNPNSPAEDVKLKSLASMNLWRQCVKCNHMIELSEGCYHMTCRTARVPKKIEIFLSDTSWDKANILQLVNVAVHFPPPFEEGILFSLGVALFFHHLKRIVLT
ncbi:hypothetical protein LWI29_007889 [Acer saccharum]|uniref:IBR domain-containing protein n=1 Tax=Acer saccharum TaxID=4024 RepID=A0AA39TCJ8_ACESA|nr:hypothetical protein LWI29_007889 [Acer saccharum]